MNERQSHLERYQTMTPVERNREMKMLFDLLPDFDATFRSEGSADYSKMEELDEKLKKRKNSDWSRNLLARLGDLLQFALITPSFKTYILGEYRHALEWSITKKTEEFLINGRNIKDIGEVEMNAELYEWSNPESGGIYDKTKAKNIEAKAFSRLFQLQLANLDAEELVGNRIEEEAEFMLKNNLAKQKVEFKRLFMSDEERKIFQKNKLEGDISAHELIEEGIERKKLAITWRQEFKEKYNEEPSLLLH